VPITGARGQAAAERKTGCSPRVCAWCAWDRPSPHTANQPGELGRLCDKRQEKEGAHTMNTSSVCVFTPLRSCLLVGRRWSAGART